MTPERMYELAAGLGAAKNRQDIAAALVFMHDDIELTSPAWGAVARGKKENAALLTHFFANYPDYEVSFEGHVADGESFVGWGVVRMTMAAGRERRARHVAQRAQDRDPGDDPDDLQGRPHRDRALHVRLRPGRRPVRHCAQDAEGYAQSCEALADATAADISTLKKPVLLITGDEDKVAPANNVDALASRFPEAFENVVLEDYGHWTVCEKPGEVASLLRKFYASS